MPMSDKLLVDGATEGTSQGGSIVEEGASVLEAIGEVDPNEGFDVELSDPPPPSENGAWTGGLEGMDSNVG